MAFNKSAFNKNSLNEAKSNAVENKISYSNNNTSRSWFKCINGIKVFQKPKDPCKIAVNILPFQKKDGSYDWIYNQFVHQIPKTEGFGTNDFICTRNDALDKIKEKIEEAATAAGQARANWDDIKAYVPKQRSIYLFNPVGTDDVCIYECGTKGSPTVKSFPERLNAQAVACAGDESIIDYASPEGGKSVVLVFTEDTFNGHKFTTVSGIAFKDRTEEISDAVWEKIPDYIEMLDNVGPDDNDKMEALINGGEISPEPEQQTEEEKQTAFEAMMVQEPKPYPKAEEKKDYGDMTLDFNQDPYTKPAPKPAASDVFACPNGFDIKTEFGTHRQCMRCPHADKCEKFAG